MVWCCVVWAHERFQVYVYGMETDHKPLELIYGPQSRPCARIERWVPRLQPYDFSVVHRTEQGNFADLLSQLLRREVKPNSHQQSAEKYIRFAVVNATPRALTSRKIEASAVDKKTSERKEGYNYGAV